MIRRIGIDFGTSTTVLQVKNYESDGVTPVGDRIDTKDVKFGKQSYCDTYVKQKQNRWYCGPEATKNIPDAITYANFKMQIESPDAAIAEGAREATLHFFQYLYKTYAEQRDNGQFGEKAEREETLVSYPVKWRQETAEFLLQTAAQAGFSNIRHMNEARAAISAVMTQSAQKLSQSKEDEQNILLCDMGAGTCDLVLCRYKASGAGELRILSCWPRGGSTLTFGGREIDRRLQEYIVGIMEKNDLPVKRLKSSLKEFKAWKELEVSPMLAEGYEVESCDIIENAANGDCIDYPPMSRALLEILIQGEMQDFIRLVNGAMQNCDEPFEKADLVILVGGNSQWYFISDLLEGKQISGDAIETTIPRDRIFCPPNPQMTVAMGLVLSDLPISVSNESVLGEAAAPDRQETDTVEPKHENDATLQSDGEAKTLVLSQEGIEVLKKFLIQMGQDQEYTSSNTQILKTEQASLPNTFDNVCGRMRAGMNILEDIKIYYAHDSTWLENGRTGLILCDKGIIGRTIGGTTRLFSWSEFIHGHLSANGCWLVDQNNSSVASIEMRGKSSDQDCAAMQKIMELQGLLKPYLVAGKGKRLVASAVQIRDIVREQMRSLEWGHHFDIYSIDQSENTIDLKNKLYLNKFLEKHNVDKTKEIYAWCDLSGLILGRGDGFLVTETGFYYKEMLEPVRFVSWEKAAESEGGFQLSGNTVAFLFQRVFLIYQDVSGVDSTVKRVAYAKAVFEVFCRIQSRIRELDL